VKFRMNHLYFIGVWVEFLDTNPPEWLVSKNYKWWWDDHVLTLDVGCHIDSDFQRITRTL